MAERRLSVMDKLRAIRERVVMYPDEMFKADIPVATAPATLVAAVDGPANPAPPAELIDAPADPLVSSRPARRQMWDMIELPDYFDAPVVDPSARAAAAEVAADEPHLSAVVQVEDPAPSAQPDAAEAAPLEASPESMTEAPRVEDPDLPVAAELDEPAPTPRHAGRVKTRLLGFEQSNGHLVDIFQKSAAEEPSLDTRFPFGWLIVVKGPGRGETFTLRAGVSQIGRDEDQAIQLDFGDTSISRSNHAAIAYDDEERAFFIGHGGKSNIVRLNRKPLLSTEKIATGDHIRIGETTLHFVALCGADFQWAEGDSAEASDKT